MKTAFDELMDEVKQEEENMSDFYKIKEGANKMRILSDFVRVESVFNNKTPKGVNFPGRKLEDKDSISMKGWAWAIIRETGDIKIVQLSKTILKQIQALKYGDEYAFENFPMPYDITINAKGAGTKEVNYSTTPARQNSEVTEEEMAQLNKKKALKDIVKAIIDKQNGNSPADNSIDYPVEEINPEDIPF